MPESTEITRLLSELSAGNRELVDSIMPRVYSELKEIAHRQLGGERVGHTLNTTALVNEAYLKLVGLEKIDWKNRAHFMGMAAISMRRILINYAKRRNAAKRGGGQFLATFDDQAVARDARPEQLLDLDEALKRLEAMNQRQAQVVTYRFFGGLTHAEVAEILDVSVPTVRRDWRLARAWLRRELAET